MDNYNLDDVKILIDKGLVTPEVLKNILKSTTRRIELYNDNDDVQILKYLSSHDSIPKETKEEINKYLSIYNEHEIDNSENKKINFKLIIIYSVLIAIILLIGFFIIINGV